MTRNKFLYSVCLGTLPNPRGPHTSWSARALSTPLACMCFWGPLTLPSSGFRFFPLRDYSVSSSELTSPPGAEERMDLHLHFPAHLHHVSINLSIKHRANFTFLSVVRLFCIKPCQGCEKWTTLRTQYSTIQYNTAHVGLLFLDVTYCFESCLYVVSCQCRFNICY
jgi:hypothetical protein